MPRMRASEKLWKIGQTVNNTTAASSAIGDVGQQTNVALLIKTDKAATFKIQVTGEGIESSGRNYDTASADWYDWYRGADADGAEVITFTGAGAKAIDLSPFAPQLFRLVCLTMSGDSTATEAYAVAV